MEVEASKESGYCVLLHLNIPHEEDYSFLITALHHWEQKHPIYTNKLHKSVSEIVKKVAPPKKAPKTEKEFKDEKLPPIQPKEALSDAPKEPVSEQPAPVVLE